MDVYDLRTTEVERVAAATAARSPNAGIMCPRIDYLHAHPTPRQDVPSLTITCFGQHAAIIGTCMQGLLTPVSLAIVQTTP
jgi:hypothetical protein